jgi:hypothetical protein
LGFFDNRLAGFMIDLFDPTALFAGEFAKQLLGFWRAVGLQTAPKGQLAIRTMAKIPAAPDLARSYSSEIVFSNIQTQNRSKVNRLPIPRFDNEIEISGFFIENLSGPFTGSGFEDLHLIFTRRQANFNSALTGVVDDVISLHRLGPLIKMDAGRIKP